MDVRPLPAPSSAEMVRGRPDGPDIVLGSGLRVRKMQLGAARVSSNELRQALAGIAALPAQDQRLVARAGVVIELVPAAALEGGILGATAIEQHNGGLWSPTLIRVAVRSPLSASQVGRHAVGEITQHEIGHAVAVLRNQDRSESAAENYALRY